MFEKVNWTCICSKVCLRTSFPAPTSLSAKNAWTWSKSNWVEKWEATEAMMWPIVKLPEWNCSKIFSQWRCRWRQAGSRPARSNFQNYIRTLSEPYARFHRLHDCIEETEEMDRHDRMLFLAKRDCLFHSCFNFSGDHVSPPRYQRHGTARYDRVSQITDYLYWTDEEIEEIRQKSCSLDTIVKERKGWDWPPAGLLTPTYCLLKRVKPPAGLEATAASTVCTSWPRTSVWLRVGLLYQ